MNWNWLLVGIMSAGVLVWLGAELDGVVRHDEHKIDTTSEMWWTLRNRLGPYGAALAIPLALLLAWVWYHLSFEGRQKRAAKTETSVDEIDPEWTDRDR